MSSPGAGLDGGEVLDARQREPHGALQAQHAAAAASGSAIISLPPKAPPSGAGRTRTRSCDQAEQVGQLLARG